MKEIIILSRNPDKTAELQALIKGIFPECKTQVLDTVKEEHILKKGKYNGKCSC